MAVLVVTSAAESQRRLRLSLCRLKLRRTAVPSLEACRQAALRRRWRVVICEAVLPDGDWRDVLELFAGEAAPRLIVTSRLADERLWSDVLHRGGYDVLAQPLADLEMDRVIRLAHADAPDRVVRRHRPDAAGPLTAAAGA